MSSPTTNSGRPGMNCDQVTKEEIAEKYLLDQLSEAQREAYEQHYFECSRCFGELKSYRALQVEFARTAPAIRQERALGRGLWRWAVAAVVAIVLLAVGIGLRLRHPAPGALPSASTSATQPPQAPQPAAPTPSLSELANIQPPPYTPLILRGPTDEATLRFREAMRHYVKADYKDAIPGLKAALKLNPRAADASFFLGICLLLTDQTDSAIGQLRRAVALGESPYLEEAHFYLTKAYLREGDLDAAQGELGKTIELHGDRESDARQLRDQLLRLREVPH